jgi:hypothetical protein
MVFVPKDQGLYESRREHDGCGRTRMSSIYIMIVDM